MVNGHFTADTAVNLGQQGGGHLNEGHPAQVGGGDEPGQVTDNAAAQGKYRRRPLGKDVAHFLVEPPGGVQRFLGFPLGNQ